MLVNTITIRLRETCLTPSVSSHGFYWMWTSTKIHLLLRTHYTSTCLPVSASRNPFRRRMYVRKSGLSLRNFILNPDLAREWFSVPQKCRTRPGQWNIPS